MAAPHGDFISWKTLPNRLCRYHHHHLLLAAEARRWGFISSWIYYTYNDNNYHLLLWEISNISGWDYKIFHQRPDKRTCNLPSSLGLFIRLVSFCPAWLIYLLRARAEPTQGLTRTQVVSSKFEAAKYAISFSKRWVLLKKNVLLDNGIVCLCLSQAIVLSPYFLFSPHDLISLSISCSCINHSIELNQTKRLQGKGKGKGKSSGSTPISSHLHDHRITFLYFFVLSPFEPHHTVS